MILGHLMLLSDVGDFTMDRKRTPDTGMVSWARGGGLGLRGGVRGKRKEQNMDDGLNCNDAIQCLAEYSGQEGGGGENFNGSTS